MNNKPSVHKPPVEYFDVLNSDGTPSGETLPRSQVHREGLWHSCIHLWIWQSSPTSTTTSLSPPQVLLQRRSPNKESYPYHFDISSAGHVSSGENVFLSLVRELWEELGVYLTFLFSTEQQPHFEQHQVSIRTTLINDGLLSPKTDCPVLQGCIVRAQYVYLHMNNKPQQQSQQQCQQFVVECTTITSPSYTTQSTLYCVGSIPQVNTVGPNYIDREYATIFLLDLSLHSPSHPHPTPDHHQQQHVATLLDAEVNSIKYIPLDDYVKHQQFLTQNMLSCQAEDNTTCEVKMVTTGSTGDDDVDIQNPHWLVPITDFENYKHKVFDLIYHLGTRHQSHSSPLLHVLQRDAKDDK